MPTDALAGPLPSELELISTELNAAFLAAQSEDWPAASAALGTVTTAWQTYQAGAVPPLLEDAMSHAADALSTAIAAQNTKEVGQAACDAARAALDLQMQYLPLATIDLARLDVWARQLQVDAAAGEYIGVLSDVVILDHIWDRVKHTVQNLPQPTCAPNSTHSGVPPSIPTSRPQRRSHGACADFSRQRVERQRIRDGHRCPEGLKDVASKNG